MIVSRQEMHREEAVHKRPLIARDKMLSDSLIVDNLLTRELAIDIRTCNARPARKALKIFP